MIFKSIFVNSIINYYFKYRLGVTAAGFIQIYFNKTIIDYFNFIFQYLN